MNMKPNRLSLTTLYILWGLILAWGVVYANNTIYSTLSQSPRHFLVNDIFSDAVFLFAAFIPVLWAPGFFGYQTGSTMRHWKMLLGMAVFFTGAPLVYRLLLGETPFGANTWFFEGIVVPLAEECFFRGVLLSMLLWGFGKMYPARTAENHHLQRPDLCQRAPEQPWPLPDRVHPVPGRLLDHTRPGFELYPGQDWKHLSGHYFACPLQPGRNALKLIEEFLMTKFLV
jgi:hypothetical protein